MSDGIYVKWRNADVTLMCSKCDRVLIFEDVKDYEHTMALKFIEENNWAFNSKGLLWCDKCLKENKEFWNAKNS